MRPPFTDSPVMQGDWPKIAPSGDAIDAMARRA